MDWFVGKTGKSPVKRRVTLEQLGISGGPKRFVPVRYCKLFCSIQ